MQMVRLTDAGVDADVAAPAEGRPSADTDTSAQWLLATLLLTGLAGAAYAQGAFYARGQLWLAVLLAIAGCLALTGTPMRFDRRLSSSAGPALLIIAAAGWPILAGALHAQLAAGLRLGLLVFAVPVTIGCARRLTGQPARLLLDGLFGLGGVLAVIGWYGVLRHHAPLAIEGQGLYRAASTLSYPNAAGVLLALLAVLGIAVAAGQPLDRPWQPRGALLTVVLVGLAATLSRGAVLALTAGLVVLATGLPGLTAGLGVRRVLAGLAWPLTGAAIGTLALLPSMPVTATGNPALATGGLLLGMAVGSSSAWAGRSGRWAYGAYGALAATAVAIGVLRPFPAVTRARLSLDSPDRWAAWRAAWRVFTAHPLTGAGPGLRSLTWRSPDGVRIFGYAHNEYLQLLATLGLLGLVLLLAGLAAIGVLLRQHRSAGAAAEGTAEGTADGAADGAAGHSNPVALLPTTAAAAVSVVLLVSMTTDFIGHFPSLVLTAAAVVGCAAPVRPARP
jgi:hypothetical protein